MTVAQIMTRDVLSFAPETSVREMALGLLERHITGAPVVKDGEVVGIVTEADLVMQRARLHIPQYISLLDSAMYLEDPDMVETALSKIVGTTAEALMTKDIVTIDDTATVEDLATLFEEEHVNPVPVINKERELVGIVSRADIVRLLVRD